MVNVLVCVTGSVAAVKLPILTSNIFVSKVNLELKVVATKSSLHFFNREDVNIPILTDEDEWATFSKLSDPVLHIELRKWADICIIAPLSANTLAKISNGISDNLLTCIIRAWDFKDPQKSVIICPAMNTLMWESKFTEKHLKICKEELGMQIIDPIVKVLACGDHDLGKGAMVEVSTINYNCATLGSLLLSKMLEGDNENRLEVTEDDRKAAENNKEIANSFFAAKKYESAIDSYTLAISHNPYVSAYYANRAFAYIKTELYGAAIRDADISIKLDSSYTKGYYRRAVANMGLGKLSDAVKDFRAVVKVAPNDNDAKRKLSECEREIRRIKFESAIAFDDPTESIIPDITKIVVEPSYDGPYLAESGPTAEFITEFILHIKNQKKLHKKYVYQILSASLDHFTNSPTIEDIKIHPGTKLTVCGDIHGQFYDLLNIFAKNGYPSSENKYLFNGDFVDRGSFSVECMLTLLVYKIWNPECIYLTRGNHETDDMNRVYGFEGEVTNKYSKDMFKLFSKIFNAIPLGNLVEEKIFVIHGGLFTRDDVTMDEIRKIDRFRQPGNTGIMSELLWSDPQPEKGRSPSKRGVGIQFGPDITKTFCDLNKLDCVIRSHEVKQDGYAIDHDGKCITIFSAPNYCDSVGNKGAYIHITPDLKRTYHQFNAVPVS
ncbi:Serine/threonine-protein phosphatase 5 [Nowakowskiella sp. JEL0078]|nr:Serine/threonine-protein phosphatase 5 [Nowakowskiella sp. JEL0078]